MAGAVGTWLKDVAKGVAVFVVGGTASLLLAAVGLALVGAVFVGIGLLADLVFDIPTTSAEVNEAREADCEPATAAPGIDTGYWAGDC